VLEDPYTMHFKEILRSYKILAKYYPIPLTGDLLFRIVLLLFEACLLPRCNA
jgi:hypothetical protein